MARDNEPVEGAEEGAEQPAEGGKSKKGLIIIIVSVLALGGGGFGAWKAFGAKKDADSKPKAEKVELLPPRYINLDPPFVVNFEAESTVRFLQVTVSIMTRDPAIEQVIKDNDPRLRNDLLLILGNQTYADVATREGKEALRQKSLEAVRTIVGEMQADSKKVEALYFSSFVMQ